LKDRIFFHRSYRVLPGRRGSRLVDLLALVLPIEILIVAFHEPILGMFIRAVKAILVPCGLETEILYAPFLPWVIRAVPVLDYPAVLPSWEFALGNLVASIILMLFLPALRFLPRPLTIYLVFLSAINLASAIFFMVAPRHFPYDIEAFSGLYMQLTFGLWLFLPLLTGFVLHLLPGGLFRKFVVLVSILLYAFAFGIIRYAVFLLLLQKFSVLYMALMFFALGPFADFVYVVSIYSIYLNRLALKLKATPEMWQWLS
jgi:hypothetical protein